MRQHVHETLSGLARLFTTRSHPTNEEQLEGAGDLRPGGSVDPIAEDASYGSNKADIEAQLSHSSSGSVSLTTIVPSVHCLRGLFAAHVG